MTPGLTLPLPAHVRLGPYRVAVRRVLPQTIRRILRRRKEDGDCAGLWNPENHAIYVDRTLTLRRQWAVYWHEIRHACADLEAEQVGGL